MKKNLAGLPLIFAIFVSACVRMGDHPASWSSASAPNVIGKCTDISGRYQNAGPSAPDSARPVLLSGLLLLEAGDEVTITQTPDTIVATSIRDGVEVSTATYSSSLTYGLGFLEGWDIHKPMAFGCPLDVASWRRDVWFNHQYTPSQFGPGASGTMFVRGDAVRYSRAEDGSLLVVFMKTSGALLLLVPVGITEEVWYRYPASGQP